MTSLFLKVLNMSLTASYVALVVIFVRMLLKRVPKVFTQLLWAVVLFRLICPVSIQSFFSLVPSDTGDVLNNIVSSQDRSTANSIIIGNNNTNTTIPFKHPSAIAGYGRGHETVVGILTILWLMGIFMLLSYAIISYFSLRRKLSVATRIDSNVFETDRIRVPFVFGFIAPKIYMPADLVGKEWAYILKHEQVHIKRRDYLIKPLVFLILSIHWFNPLIWACYFLMAKDMEMSCDESVIQHSDTDIRISYSNSLLSLSVKMSGFFGPLAFGEGNVKSRIKNVLNYKRPAFKAVAAAFITVVIIGIGLIINPKASPKTAYAAATDTSANIPTNGIALSPSPDWVAAASAASSQNIVYQNSQYGFDFNLPASWNGYKIITGTWQGTDVNTGKVSQTGVIITIRNPLWTSEKPYQDIPVMVFTIVQWNSLQQEEYSVGAAPISPTELGRNSKYVFAIPARYNYAFPAGWEEVETILQGEPLQPTEDFRAE